MKQFIFKHIRLYAIFILPALFASFTSSAQILKKFEDNYKLGLKDANGRVQKSAIYIDLKYSKGVWLGLLTEETVMLDEKGYPLTKGGYSLIVSDTTPLLKAEKVYKNGEPIQVGALDRKGREIIPFIYADVQVLDRFVIVTTQDRKFGLTDLQHNFVFPAQYFFIQLFRRADSLGDFILLKSNPTTTTVCDTGGNILFRDLQDLEFDGLPIFIHRKNQKFGVTDFKGKQLIPFVYKSIQRDGEYLRAIKDDGTTENFNDKFQKVK